MLQLHKLHTATGCASLMAAPCAKWHIALLPHSTLFSGFFRSVMCLPQTSFVLRFRIRLMHFDNSICHVPGKHLYTANSLSCAPVASPDAITCQESARTELFAQTITSNLPASADRLREYRAAQEQDSTCSQLIAFCKHGWPNKDQLTRDLLWYWCVREELFLHDDLLL